MGQKEARTSSEVTVGNVQIGGEHPIRIQTMTNTSTLNIEETVSQCVKLFNAGADLVRIAVPTVLETNNLAEIKMQLKALGIDKPIIADIHFNPLLAELAATIVEKVRINPGNYSDKKKWGDNVSSEEEYDNDIKTLNSRIRPLLETCKKNGTAIRIGTNHGSLSHRILNRYGDTPNGMVESAMEFVRICRKHEFENLVLSMKASNTLIMVNAHRLLVLEMNSENCYFPLHIGVTESGEGEDARLKSAVGIGTLLLEGIGDTIRVSLSEPPEKELPVAAFLAETYNKTLIRNLLRRYPFHEKHAHPQRKSTEARGIGGQKVPIVIGETDPQKKSLPREKTVISEDFCYTQESHPSDTRRKNIIDADFWNSGLPDNYYPLFSIDGFLTANQKHRTLNFIAASSKEIDLKAIEKLKTYTNIVLILQFTGIEGVFATKAVFHRLAEIGFTAPIIINPSYKEMDTESFLLAAAAENGAFFIDHLADGIWLRNEILQNDAFVTSIAFGILQAAGARKEKTEYISCPTCGRTLFDFTTVNHDLKRRTSHLKGLTIAMMGCIVNGPGEMADANYGCIISGKQLFTVYKGKIIYRKNVAEEEVVDVLINAIKENGDWIAEIF